MVALQVLGKHGVGVDHRATLSHATRHWGITPELRALCLKRIQEALDDANLNAAERRAWIRLAATLDAADDKRERDNVFERQASAALALETVRTQLAAQLAAGQAGIGAAGLVIPAIPPQAAIPSHLAPQPPESDVVASCPTCQDATYIASPSGALPCPACNTDAPPGERIPPVQVRRPVNLADLDATDRRKRQHEQEIDGPPADAIDLAY